MRLEAIVDERLQVHDEQGRLVFSYLSVGSPSEPRAVAPEFAVPLAQAVPVIRRALPGWLIGTTPAAGRQLVALGLPLHRHAVQMGRDLPADPADTTPPDGVEFVPCDRPAGDIQPALSAAFPPGHIDHDLEEPLVDGRTELERLLTGELVGPMLGCSLLAVGQTGVVVAGCLVNQLERPWITLMFRDPATSPPGVGMRLLQAVLARAAEDGLTAMGLAVTAGNPAQRVYERAGFEIMNEVYTVRVPA